MVQKILAALICGSLASVSYASFAPYVGGSMGVITNTSSRVDVSPDSNPTTQPGYFRGIPLVAFLGYGGVFSQCFYLAAEVEFTLWTIELANENGLKTTYGYGASLLPGLLLSDHTLAFLRFGVARSRFSDESLTVTGGKIGIGLQTTVTQNIDLRGEYDFIAYRSVNNNYGQIHTPRADAFLVSVLYKFD